MPLVVLPMPPSDDVMSLSKSKKPAPSPGMKVSTPIFRQSPPNLNVCEPENFENVALALVDFQLISVGLIAPSVREP